MEVNEDTQMENYAFGYPKQCTKCMSFSSHPHQLRVQPYLKDSESNNKVMLIGQDPTIYRKPERVKYVLMLDEENGQLRRWLAGLFNGNNFEAITLYATNLVKCSFDQAPYSSLQGTISFLKPYFEQCKGYLIKEIARFKPDLILTLGEPAHRLFISILDNQKDFLFPMKEAFTGEFKKAMLEGIEFQYSPCLHIKTFRVAETYGDMVGQFKNTLKQYLER